MSRFEIYNYIGYMNDKNNEIPESHAISIPEKEDYVFKYLDEIKDFIYNIDKEDFKNFNDEEYFDRTKAYIDLEKEVNEKHNGQLTFELADKFVKACIIYKLSLLDKSMNGTLKTKDGLKILASKDRTSQIPRIIINSYIREALNQLDVLHNVEFRCP